MFAITRGQLQFRRRGAASIGAHWSVLIGLAVFSRMTFEPWFILGFLVLIGVHELGHAALVRRYGLTVEAIVFHGLGGECRYSGRITARKRQVIAWGGVLAQAALLLVVWLIADILPPETSTGRAWPLLYHTFVVTNLWMIGLNLLPFPGFDGYHAWRVLAPDSSPSSSSAKKSKTAPKSKTKSALRSKGARPGPTSNVIAFPTERVGHRASDEESAAFSDVHAQIVGITERVNAKIREAGEAPSPEMPKSDDEGEPPAT